VTEGKTTILVVDDEETIRSLIKQIMQDAGYDVTTAANGEEALNILSQQKERSPDLVILDIMMPGLNGLEVLDIIRGRFDIPVIMLTAKQAVTTVRDALAIGADDYVRKPFRTTELVARVKAKLRRAGLKQIEK
jgi:two-component system OmpR family response regulator/two-component system alkaline phosphatase synthesis response regulator PhoP